MTEPKAPYPGLENLHARLQKMQQRGIRCAKDAIQHMEKDHDEAIERYLDSHIHHAVQKLLGVGAFGDMEEKGLLRELLEPHVRRVAQQFINDFFDKPLPKPWIATLRSAFNTGYKNAVADIGYELGKELADKHQEQLRHLLLGDDDLVEQTEDKMTG